MIHVVGIVGDSLDELSSNARAQVLKAKTIIGASWRIQAIERLLTTNSIELMPFPRPFSKLAKLLEVVPKPCVILASGDPGFFGITRYLSNHNLVFEVTPAPSSISYAAAKLRIPWEHFVVLSAHGRDDEAFQDMAQRCLIDPSQSIAILSGPTFPPENVIKLLRGYTEPSDQIWIFENILTAKERISGPSPEDRTYSHNSVILLLRSVSDNVASVSSATKTSSALSVFDEDQFHHPDSNYSKIEVKSMIPALLQIDSLPTGSRFLEIGAGHGGIGITVCRLRPDLNLFQYEQDKTKINTLEMNLNTFNVKSTLIAKSFFPKDVETIRPSAIFVGGGGVRLAVAIYELAPKGTRICVSFVSPEDLPLAYDVFGNVKEVFSNDLKRFGPRKDRTRLIPSNPVFLAWNEF